MTHRRPPGPTTVKMSTPHPTPARQPRHTTPHTSPHLTLLARSIVLALLVSIIPLLPIPSATQAQTADTLFYESFNSPTLDTDKWNRQDSQNKISFALDPGYLHFLEGRSSPTWSDPAIYTRRTFERVPGRSLVSIVRSEVSWNNGPVYHFSPVAFPPNANTAGYGISIDNNGETFPQYSRFNAIFPGFSIPYNLQNSGYDPATVRSIDYLTATVLRPSGSYHLVTGGTFGAYPEATLIWVNGRGNDRDLFVGLNNFDANSLIDSIKVVDLPGPFTTDNGLAVAADSFRRPDTTSLSATEIGGLPWTEKLGDLAIAGGRVGRVGTNEARAVIGPATADGIFEMTFSTPAEPFGNLLLYFRYQDELNWWRVRCNEWITAIDRNVSGGVSAVYQTGSLGCKQNTTNRIVVRAHGSSIGVWLNDVDVTLGRTGVTDSTLIRATGVGIGIGANNRTPLIDNFKVWPRKVTLPQQAGPAPRLPAEGTTTIVTDNFTDAEGKPLTAHLTDQGGTWTSEGNWVVSNNQAKPTKQKIIATTQTGLTDIAVSADVTLPRASSGTTEWFAGLAARYTNDLNYIQARFLWQGGSPEIEIWDISSKGNRFLNATNVSKLITEDTTHNLKLVVMGDQVAAYMDGSLIVQGVTSISSGTRAGLYIDYGASSPLSVFDNFKVTRAMDGSIHTPQPTPSPTPTQQTANGLLGTYFGNQDLSDPRLTRIDPVIDFNWGSGSPSPLIANERFSVRWTGKIRPPVSGKYNFHALTDDGVRLWINNTLVIDHWQLNIDEISGSIDLIEGVKYDIRLEYFENEGHAVSQLRWSGPGISKQIIGQTYLYPQ